MTFTPNASYVETKQKEETRKDDELFVRLASEVIPPTLRPDMTDEQFEARLEKLWIWWNAP